MDITATEGLGTLLAYRNTRGRYGRSITCTRRRTPNRRTRAARRIAKESHLTLGEIGEVIPRQMCVGTQATQNSFRSRRARTDQPPCACLRSDLPYTIGILAQE